MYNPTRKYLETRASRILHAQGMPKKHIAGFVNALEADELVAICEKAAQGLVVVVGPTIVADKGSDTDTGAALLTELGDVWRTPPGKFPLPSRMQRGHDVCPLPNRTESKIRNFPRGPDYNPLGSMQGNSFALSPFLEIRILEALGKTQVDVAAYLDHPAAQEAGLCVWDYIENEIKGLRDAIKRIEEEARPPYKEFYAARVLKIIAKMRGE
jgi:hypothetical protein